MSDRFRAKRLCFRPPQLTPIYLGLHPVVNWRDVPPDVWFAVYSNGVNSSSSSSSWQWDGICAYRFRTATSKSYWPSVDSRLITSPSGAAVRPGVGAVPAQKTQGNKRLVAGGRDVRPGQRQMGVLVPGCRLLRCNDRDFLLSAKRNAVAAERFLSQSLGRCELPEPEGPNQAPILGSPSPPSRSLRQPNSAAFPMRHAILLLNFFHGRQQR